LPLLLSSILGTANEIDRLLHLRPQGIFPPVPFAPHHHASPCGLSDEETQANNLLGTERTAAFKGALGGSPLLGPEQWPRASRRYPPCLPNADVWHTVDAQKIFVGKRGRKKRRVRNLLLM